MTFIKKSDTTLKINNAPPFDLSKLLGGKFVFVVNQFVLVNLK